MSQVYLLRVRDRGQDNPSSPPTSRCNSRNHAASSTNPDGLTTPTHQSRPRGPSRRAIRQHHDQMHNPVQPLEPASEQQPDQRMRLRDNPYLTRQHRTKLLQSVAFAPRTGKTHVHRADLVETLYRALAHNSRQDNRDCAAQRSSLVTQ
jgi:hypothetical protein